MWTWAKRILEYMGNAWGHHYLSLVEDKLEHLLNDDNMVILFLSQHLQSLVLVYLYHKWILQQFNHKLCSWYMYATKLIVDAIKHQCTFTFVNCLHTIMELQWIIPSYLYIYYLFKKIWMMWCWFIWVNQKYYPRCFIFSYFGM